MKLEFNNIFDAITDNKSEASRLKTRSNLMIFIREIINATRKIYHPMRVSLP
ncbi:Putative uncharacterized protein XF1677 [Moritella viscosa]|uniref:hypothetical protein n=1 Tax=Moritella viscosa TaxID=80854 RepID=UPI00090F088B|nr:hypothetical protein [Moritella viscosa]SHO00240.1 Putative uncharacterized protein XF1677 [Moritella viscosa]SHO20253.1 Putative uncharacterized protein XF1677 [Moritella viscosa]